ncbi:MAG: hypothetical protein M3Z20_14185 [Chloroflexota bacterium]|nr:hypothetical protein [Chloroflexota bacterium]
MDGSRFDSLVGRLTAPGSRRRALRALGLSALFAGGLQAAAPETDARRRRKHGKGKKGKKGNKGNKGGGGTPLELRDICTPGKSTCDSGLRCDSPTTRHSCSSTVEGVDAWCCVPPGGKCTECDCCGDNYCNGDGVCETNPEG